ncbi:hypothetical protein ACFP8W_09130 [Nocardioides hankookensis]|uniref:Uncharacterized protein n=1 Tax=Nocardioides hankookensis TaxID=443157 RepID=A0ABW1LMS2_9ACTN
MRAGDGSGQRGHTTPRHVWVNVTGSAAYRYAGVLIDWRVDGRGSWEALVVWVDGGGNLKAHAHMGWVAAAHVRPTDDQVD